MIKILEERGLEWFSDVNGYRSGPYYILRPRHGVRKHGWRARCRGWRSSRVGTKPGAARFFGDFASFAEAAYVCELHFMREQAC